MSTKQQPEALRLARKFEEVGFMGDHQFAKDHWCRQAAAELRHQHARVTELEDVADMAIKRIAELEAQLSAIGVGCGPAAAAQGVNAPNEWEDIRTLPTCDDLIWLYCQDTTTIDGPIAPEPNLEEYGWSHWAYAYAPSTAWIDAAQAKQGGV